MDAGGLKLNTRNIPNTAIQEFENKIREVYISRLNELISFYEVYNHDLHADVVESIVMIFQNYCVAEVETDVDKKNKLLNSTYSKCLITCRQLYILLIDTYLKRIILLRKFYKKFNVKGVVLEIEDCENNGEMDIFFSSVTADELKKLKINIRKIRKAYSKSLKANEQFDDLISESQLEEVGQIYSQAKDLLEKHEKYYSKILSNGYNGTSFLHIIKLSYLIISVVLALLAILIYFLNN